MTADTFYYATEDTDEQNTFGTPQKLMAYDLLTGKTRTVLNGVSDIAQMCRIGNTLYFTCYTYTNTNKTQWGFLSVCLRYRQGLASMHLRHAQYQ